MVETTRAGREKLRTAVYRALEPDEAGRGFTALSFLLACLVVASLVTLAIETEQSAPGAFLPAWLTQTADAFNSLIVVVFALEFLLRLWSAGEDLRYQGWAGRLRYVARPLPLADLAAFLPELMLEFLQPEMGGAAFAALRALRLFRLFKLARYVPAFSILWRALRRAGPGLAVTAVIALVQLYTAALLLYFVEGDVPGQEANFGSVPRALWWAVVTLTTVGYGDVYPITPLGRVAAAFVALIGIGVVALPTGIIASAFAEEARERLESRRRPPPPS